MSSVPLHVYSQYSVLRSAASVEQLVSKAVEYEYSSLALTDQGNMFGSVEFYKECKAKGVHPILGCELHVAPVSRLEKKKVHGLSAGYPIIFFIKNAEGYRNLCKLSSLAHLEGFYYTPRIDRELIQKYAGGLICLTGNIYSKVGAWIIDGKEQELQEEVDWLQALFKEDLYFELQRYPCEEKLLEEDLIHQEPWLYQKMQDWTAKQNTINQRLLELSLQKQIPCVATNTVHYIDRKDWKAHEILINIQSGEPCEIWEKDSAGNLKSKKINPKREVLYSHEMYFPSQERMGQLFSDLPETLQNSLQIAKKCAFHFDFATKYYPVFVPPQLENTSYTEKERALAAEQFLRHLCEEGIARRYTEDALVHVQKKYPGQDPLQVVRSRLQYELDIITSKGMGDYLLIVYDFINWAKNRHIPMGPGRGSGAGSIILYLIGVTDIEPLRFSLFFERFINPERISYPDIDVDICMERRQEVIDYTVSKYGKERVAQIITFGTMKAKMAIKDVGRVLNVPLSKVNALAKLIPEDPGMTLEKALEIDAQLYSQYEEDPEVHNLITIALRLEGSIRNTGIHAAGLIIGSGPLMENIPLCSPKDSSMAVTQFSMKPVESVGLLKIDFLGLKTLTSIQKAVNAIEISSGKHLSWANLPLDDRPTFDLLNQGKTQGIFQLESGGMQELVKQLQLDKFEEIIAVGALYRPGPMEMIPSFIQRKHGKETIEIDHPFMADILAETYGIMVYQEQVMQIASRLANYSLGEGDVLRRAMGKKDKEEMSKQREKFRKGALHNQIDSDTSMKIFDKIEKFASYGFNKSHAAAYGYLTYVTAYLKSNYPMQWVAALMTSDKDDVTKVAKMIRECQSNGIAVLPPDINASSHEFLATPDGIRFAMSGIKSVGEGVVDLILEERKKGGHFPSLYQFIHRIDTKKIGKKTIESLIEAGCFDFTGWSRDALRESVDPMFMTVAKEQKEAALGFIDFFSLIEENHSKTFEVPPVPKHPTTKQQMLQREYELLGFYLREHPLEEYRPFFDTYSCYPLCELSKADRSFVCRTAFIIETVSVKISAKTQKKFAILTISDGIEHYELPIWSDLYEQAHALLVENRLIYAVLTIEKQQEERKLSCKWLTDLTSVTEDVLRTCDEVYERAKAMLQVSELKEKRKNQVVKNMGSKVENSIRNAEKLLPAIHISIDMHKAKMSHILEIKKIFQKERGASPIEVHFLVKNKNRGKLYIAKEWGVVWSAKLEMELKEIESVVTVSQGKL